ncbi:MAG: 1-deoxy-D-xylulose-5-phosphate reductoisomerase [Peptostreptococcaceae bacterium]|jgi:1-deoxy-D-xylulose-5-phosphate reductoisomerase|nr:1-deoxy-D-xylulose-5-phosphate reductoisomerase [Peptostreptococcaceae bacterium]
MKNISILGSTGSIGEQTLDVIRKNKDKFKVSSLAVNSNIDLLIKQIEEFKPKKVCVYDEDKYKLLKEKVNNIEIFWGMEGLLKLVKDEDVDIVITAVVGMIGLLPTLKAIEYKKTIGLANKETLVTAGELVMKKAKENEVSIIPVDSEHSAIFQCLNGERNKDINKIILTASGGPFRGKKKEELLNITKKEALNHPNWSMGNKISIDSSTLMNKGLEVIEAKWLFDIDVEDIEVIVHPQSIVHSMVEFKDKSIIAQMGNPDMRVPIQYALTYPNRIENDFERLDFLKFNNLTFEKPDLNTFPCLNLAYEALKKGGTYACVLNAANEELVKLFLEDKIKFYDIPTLIEKTIKNHNSIKSPELKDILNADLWARDFIKKEILNR